jgi:hypothetical protein
VGSARVRFVEKKGFGSQQHFLDPSGQGLKTGVRERYRSRLDVIHLTSLDALGRGIN